VTVRAYKDPSYGINQSNGKFHTGCDIVLGNAGVIDIRSPKQNIVTDPSIKVELVGFPTPLHK